ncbi:MAG: hypothetical protein HNEKOMLI_00571 [Sodalis sp. Psp]|nr:hypothetical protein [Sodalis sp. Psp]MCR3757043.1 hypothetical protein [Sodalis sp. Ppy]
MLQQQLPTAKIHLSAKRINCIICNARESGSSTMPYPIRFKKQPQETGLVIFFATPSNLTHDLSHRTVITRTLFSSHSVVFYLHRLLLYGGIFCLLAIYRNNVVPDSWRHSHRQEDLFKHTVPLLLIPRTTRWSTYSWYS